LLKKLARLSVNLSFINVQSLTDNEIEGKVIEPKTRYHDQDYIISDRVGSDRSITINGKHYGVEVRGRVFDHLSPKGMKREDWLKIFIAKVKSL
jgi:hypothetical protein